MGALEIPDMIWYDDWRCWLGGGEGIQHVKTEWCGAGMIIWLERGAVLHMAQLMPLPLTVSCFSKIQIGFTFLILADLGTPRKTSCYTDVCIFFLHFWEQLAQVVRVKRPLNVCVCVLMKLIDFVHVCVLCSGPVSHAASRPGLVFSVTVYVYEIATRC